MITIWVLYLRNAKIDIHFSICLQTICQFIGDDASTGFPNSCGNMRLKLRQAIKPKPRMTLSRATAATISCKIQYYIKANSADRSSRSAFFTDDCLEDVHCVRDAGDADDPIAAGAPAQKLGCRFLIVFRFGLLDRLLGLSSVRLIKRT